jgi:hypothetical protein
MAEKKPRLVTPVGEAKWAHVFTPKAPFKGDASKGEKYMIDVVFDPAEPKWKEWAGELKKAIEALPPQVDKATGAVKAKQMPIKRELDRDDKPTGRFFVTFKTGAQFKPGVFDRYGMPLPEGSSVGNGSKVRVSYMTAEYKEFGGGIALYLNAVQVLELVEYKSHDAKGFGFDVEEPPQQAPAHAAAAGGPPPAEDDLPF